MFTNKDTAETRGTQFLYWAVLVASVGLFGIAAFSPAPQAAVPAPTKVVQLTAPDQTIETVTVVAKRRAS